MRRQGGARRQVPGIEERESHEINGVLATSRLIRDAPAAESRQTSAPIGGIIEAQIEQGIGTIRGGRALRLRESCDLRAEPGAHLTPRGQIEKPAVQAVHRIEMFGCDVRLLLPTAAECFLHKSTPFAAKIPLAVTLTL